jgi:hypothetical protein
VGIDERSAEGHVERIRIRPVTSAATSRLLDRYRQAGGRYMVCPLCFNAKQLDKGSLLGNAELAGTVQLWEWIGDEAATTFSYKDQLPGREPPASASRRGALAAWRHRVAGRRGRLGGSPAC